MTKVEIKLPNRTYYKQYGRCINLSIGLIFGLLLDKLLFYLTKGISTIFPPLSVLLMNKGKVLYSLRFEKRFNPMFEKFLSHITTK